MPIYLDISLLLLVGIYMFSSGSISGGIVAAISVAVAILVHEIGHALVGKVFGCYVSEITVMFFGGNASMYNIPKDPAKDAAISLSGPAFGFALWLVSSFVLAPIFAVNLLKYLFLCIGQVSLFLTLFNLIPALPLDGGRAFRSILSIYLGRKKATQISCRIAKVVAVIMGLWGLARLNAFMILCAFFVWSSSKNELAMLKYGSDVDDDTIIISPPPYGKGNVYKKIHRER